MSDMPFGKPVHLGQLLGNLVRKRGIAEQSSRHELDDVWRTVAGERIASKSYVRRLKSGVLEIGVTNGAILEELTCYLKHEILPGIQQKHPEPPINSLKFVRARSC